MFDFVSDMVLLSGIVIGTAPLPCEFCARRNVINTEFFHLFTDASYNTQFYACNDLKNEDYLTYNNPPECPDFGTTYSGNSPIECKNYNTCNYRLELREIQNMKQYAKVLFYAIIL